MKKNTLALQDRIIRYPDIHTKEQIDTAAHALEGMNYRPMLLIDMPDFFYITSDGLLAELNRLVKMTSEEWSAAGCPAHVAHTDFRDKQIGLIFYHYALLYRLRSNEPDAWNEINLLCEDD